MLIVSYDFANDKTRTKFSKYLEKYGWRMQYSVFIIRNSKRVISNIISEIEKIYKPKFEMSDSIIIFPVCKTCDGKLIRYGNAKHMEEDVIYF